MYEHLLKQFRLQAGLTQEDLAHAVGTTTISIWRWERGAFPSTYYQEQLCRYFQTSPEKLGWVTSESEPKKPLGSLVDPLVVPPTRPFVGRRSELAFLQSQMWLPGKHHVGIAGLPGSGKTALVQQFVTRENTQNAFDGIFWASSGQGIPLAHHVQRWGTLLGLSALPPTLMEAQNLFRTTIGQRRFLFVLDHICSAEEIDPFFRMGGPRCCFLLTTQQPGVGHLFCQHLLHLPDLTEKDAFTLLTTGLPTPLVAAHRQALHSLVEGTKRLPEELVWIAEELRQGAETQFHRFPSILARLSQQDCSDRLDDLPLYRAISHREATLGRSQRHLFRALVERFLDTPFQAREAARVVREEALASSLNSLNDAGFVEWKEGRYSFHPVLVRYYLAAQNRLDWPY